MEAASQMEGEFAKGLKFRNPQTHNGTPLGSLAKWETRLRPAADVQVADGMAVKFSTVAALESFGHPAGFNWKKFWILRSLALLVLLCDVLLGQDAWGNL